MSSDDDLPDDGSGQTPRPVLRIVRGDPSPEEVAALAAVLAAASGGGGAEPQAGPTSVWTEREALVRRPLSPGPGAWRMSALPR